MGQVVGEQLLSLPGADVVGNLTPDKLARSDREALFPLCDRFLAEMLATLRSLSARGIIRRFGATLRHQKSGFPANALVAWSVPAGDLSAIGKKMAGYREVSHCYARTPAPSWPYNLYTMIHGKTPEDCVSTAARLAAETGIADYQMLFSETELKKTTMRYFKEEK